MSITCVIPARGGSKGIPRKNLQHVGGLPLIDRAILAVAQSGDASAIFVSTEDSEIASRAI
ncbi:MAG: cytidylyltransferase domain-containing protein, partial [Ilumatobacteraceae bacterium]